MKMSTTMLSFRWLDLLEKEFDRTFVDIDIFIADLEDPDDGEWINDVRSKLGSLSSCFAQLAHKAQTIFQTNAKYEAELLNLRHELAEEKATTKVLKEETHELLMQLHASQLKFHNNFAKQLSNDSSSDKIRERLEKELDEERVKRLSLQIPKEELVLLRRENGDLRKHSLLLQGELTGAKLTSKYLDQELAGRIQQLQLVTREMSSDEHRKLWSQLEAKILVHRHKTVVRACRANAAKTSGSISLDDDISELSVLNGGNRFESRVIMPPKPTPDKHHRVVVFNKPPGEGLGVAITGGLEHGVPIVISLLHPGRVAAMSGQLFVGDTIMAVNGRSLSQSSHNDAVDILSAVEGEVALEVIYVCPDEDDENSQHNVDINPFKLMDDELCSVAGSLQFLQNGRLSRASIDSIRGSTDDMLESPRKLPDEDWEESPPNIEEEKERINLGSPEETIKTECIYYDEEINGEKEEAECDREEIIQEKDDQIEENVEKNIVIEEKEEKNIGIEKSEELEEELIKKENEVEHKECTQNNVDDTENSHLILDSSSTKEENTKLQITNANGDSNLDATLISNSVFNCNY